MFWISISSLTASILLMPKPCWSGTMQSLSGCNICKRSHSPSKSLTRCRNSPIRTQNKHSSPAMATPCLWRRIKLFWLRLGIFQKAAAKSRGTALGHSIFKLRAEFIFSTNPSRSQVIQHVLPSTAKNSLVLNLPSKHVQTNLSGWVAYGLI